MRFGKCGSLALVVCASMGIMLSVFPAAAAETGSIKGTVRASRVRSPENVLVYIEEAPGEFKAPEEPVEMDQYKLVFVPHVLPIVKGTTVRYLNSDPIVHNVMWPASDNGAYQARNLGSWSKGGFKDYKYDAEGHLVILCNVHPEMVAHVVVLQNPFSAVVDESGDYEIKDVPPGTYTVKTWYESARRLPSKSAEVTVKAGESAELDFSLGR